MIFGSDAVSSFTSLTTPRPAWGAVELQQDLVIQVLLSPCLQVLCLQAPSEIGMRALVRISWCISRRIQRRRARDWEMRSAVVLGFRGCALWQSRIIRLSRMALPPPRGQNVGS